VTAQPPASEAQAEQHDGGVNEDRSADQRELDRQIQILLGGGISTSRQVTNGDSLRRSDLRNAESGHHVSHVVVDDRGEHAGKRSQRSPLARSSTKLHPIPLPSN
jgi:hypothetical protein